MPPACTKAHLRRLRNEIPIRQVIADILQIPSKLSEGRFRFLCPLCREFDTATNPDTNLARCFPCKQNFNPIDITMIDRRYDFLATVSFLEAYLPDQQLPAQASDGNSTSLGA